MYLRWWPEPKGSSCESVRRIGSGAVQMGQMWGMEAEGRNGPQVFGLVSELIWKEAMNHHLERKT
jgi:hypothetical protein